MVLGHKAIDAHCHVYPDKIASAAVGATDRFYGVTSHFDGSVNALLSQCKETGIDHAVVQSVATTPKQVSSINNFIAKTVAENKGLTGLGTLHPESADIEADVEELMNLGLRGVKLHPDIQRFKIDDYRCLKIYELCEKNKLPILIHTGDKELVYTVNSKVKGLLDVFCANIEGSLQMNFEGAQYWNFFDWSDRLDGAIFSSEKKKIDIMLSLLTVIALKAYKEICKISEMEFSYQIVINELSQSFKEKLYDEKSGLVLLNGKALELPNALLVLSGILTKDEEQKICKAIMSGKLGECSLSMKCFVYDALIKSGEGAKEYILSKIRENYERMIETGTVWETLKGTHEFDNAGSLCHGWSAVPVYYYNLFYNIDRNK